MFTITHNTKRNIFIFSAIVLIVLAIFLYINKSSIISWVNKITSGQEENQSNIQSFTNYTNYRDNFKNELFGKSKNLSNKKDIVTSYCDTLLNDDFFNKGFVNLHGGGAGSKYFYDPKKSIFLYNLCTYVGDYDEKFSITTGDNVPLNETFDLKHKEDRCREKEVCETYCDPNSDMNSCNIGFELSKRFHALINEFFNIKLATIYGYKGDDTEDAIKDFSKKYFPDIICDKENYYLYKEELTAPVKKYCSHPKTYQLLKDQIESLKSLIENNSLSPWDTKVDYLGKKAYNKKIEDIEENCFSKELSPRIECAFNNYTTSNSSDLKSFYNLALNEMIYYKWFLVYYTYNITSHGKFQELSMSSDITNKFETQNQKVVRAKNELNRTQKALEKANRLLLNVYYTFPIHIGLMAYYEDLMNFREKFSNIYTPIHQLYYKLRNVQTKRR